MNKYVEWIKQSDKEIIANLDSKDLEFPVSKKAICINVFRYKNKHTNLIYLLKEKFENHIELLLIGNEAKWQKVTK